MYYIRFKTSLLIQLVTCFYCSTQLVHPFFSLLINDVMMLKLKDVFPGRPFLFIVLLIKLINY